MLMSMDLRVSKILLKDDHWVAIDFANVNKSELPLRVVTDLLVLSSEEDIEIWVEAME